VLWVLYDRVLRVDPRRPDDLAGTSSGEVADALVDRPHRLLSLGVGNVELRRYGTPADHRRAHGLDAEGIRASLAAIA
jgi:transketolase